MASSDRKQRTNTLQKQLSDFVKQLQVRNALKGWLGTFMACGELTLLTVLKPWPDLIHGITLDSCGVATTVVRHFISVVTPCRQFWQFLANISVLAAETFAHRPPCHCTWASPTYSHARKLCRQGTLHTLRVLVTSSCSCFLAGLQSIACSTGVIFCSSKLSPGDQAGERGHTAASLWGYTC